MTPESLLVLIFGMVAGFGLGWVTAWRLARKLEAHGVQLWKWDRPFDPQAVVDNVRPFERQSSR